VFQNSPPLCISPPVAGPVALVTVRAPVFTKAKITQ
jgi:hypothetical protein